MLSYSACSSFYKCPFLFQKRNELNVQTQAMRIGTNLDYIINVLLTHNIKNEVKKEETAITLGISDMMLKMAKGADICNLVEVPKMIKEWYMDFLNSGFEVLGVQEHFMIDDLDYHGYIDAVYGYKGKRIVAETKTTVNFYDKYMSAKKDSYQAVGYCLGVDTDEVRYQFFNTKNMSEYRPYSKLVTQQEIDEFREWVMFVKNNEKSFIKNKEFCSQYTCLNREDCYGETY